MSMSNPEHLDLGGDFRWHGVQPTTQAGPATPSFKVAHGLPIVVRGDGGSLRRLLEVASGQSAVPHGPNREGFDYVSRFFPVERITA